MFRHIGITLLCMMAASPSFAEDAKKPAIASEELPAPSSAELPLEYNVVVLQGLNKVTGQIQKFESPVGSTTRFGTLEIALLRCWKSLPEDRPENAALIEISEVKTGEAPLQIFLGWIFSSSPGLSGLEHPVYDVTLLSCDTTSEEAPKPAADDKKKAPASEPKK